MTICPSARMPGAVRGARDGFPERLEASDPRVQQALGRKPRRFLKAGRQESIVSREGVAIVFRVARELKSPNTWNGAHWTVKHRESQAWEHALYGAIFTHAGGTTVWQHVDIQLACEGQRQAMTSKPLRMRVTIERLAPSRRRFIRDDDNLAFTSKPVLDALKRLGYIHNDSRKWLEHPCPTQRVSDDGCFWTVIRIEPVEVGAGPPEG